MMMPRSAMFAVLVLLCSASSPMAGGTLTFAPSVRMDRRPDGAACGGPLAIDGRGNVYTVYWGSDISIYFNRSTDGGATFEASDYLISEIGWNPYPSIAADDNGHVYAVWEQGFNRSTDSGATWEGPRSVTGGAGCSLPRIAADQFGRVFVARSDWESVYVDISYDFGATFDVHKRVTYGIAFVSDIATDGRGNVYVAFGYPSSGDPDIYFTRSWDSGDTWSTPELIGQWESPTGRTSRASPRPATGYTSCGPREARRAICFSERPRIAG